jgi:hypothetical protein
MRTRQSLTAAVAALLLAGGCGSAQSPVLYPARRSARSAAR